MEESVSFEAALQTLDDAPASLDSLETTCSRLGFTHPTHFGVLPIGGLELQQNPRELAELAAFLIREAPLKRLRYLEVGIGSCGTMVFLHRVLRKHGIELELFGVDNFIYADAGILPNQRARVEWARGELGATFHIGDTADEGFADFLREQTFEIVFIDGDHTFEACVREFLICQAHLAPDGIMIFHDVASKQCPGVVAAYDRIKAYFRFNSEIVHSDTCGIGICRFLAKPVNADAFFRPLIGDSGAAAIEADLK